MKRCNYVKGDEKNAKTLRMRHWLRTRAAALKYRATKKDTEPMRHAAPSKKSESTMNTSVVKSEKAKLMREWAKKQRALKGDQAC